jgi:dihydrofolate reductase
MNCSVFIATSVDGFIARDDGNIDWLESSGNQDAEMGDNADMGFNDFIDTVDCIVMGRNTMETIASFNLTPEQWPYRDIPIIVLSNTITTPPDALKGKIKIYSGDLHVLLSKLEDDGYKHTYIDGGRCIQEFLSLGLINEMTITHIPILLGSGIPLLGETVQEIQLKQATATAYPNDLIQVHYKVSYPEG